MPKKESKSFAKAFEELEEIVAWFEREDIDVEEGIKKFEQGLELAKLCKERLVKIENRVKEISDNFKDDGDEASGNLENIDS